MEVEKKNSTPEKNNKPNEAVAIVRLPTMVVGKLVWDSGPVGKTATIITAVAATAVVAEVVGVVSGVEAIRPSTYIAKWRK